MSNSVWPHRRQPTRLCHPWDSPGKNTGVGCHFLLQCMKVKSESEVAQSCPTPRDPMDCSLLGSSIHGVFQARVLEWGAIAFWQQHQGEVKGGMIWENSIETCILPYVKQMASARSMHEAGHSKLVLWDNPEGWGGGDSGWGDTCTPMAWLLLMYGKTTTIL